METMISARDAKFAKLAVELKYVTPEQVSGSIALFRRYSKANGEIPSIPRILVGKGYLSRAFAERLLRHLINGEALPAPAIPAVSIIKVPKVANAAPPMEVAPEVPGELRGSLDDVFADLTADSGAGQISGIEASDEQEAMIKGLGATVLRSAIKGYKILEVVGEGSMGVVYRAHQISMDRIVALKVLPEDKTKDHSFVEQFLAEARSAGRLNHPNLIRVHEVGREEDLYYYSMEYVEGLTLGEMMDEFEGGRMEPKRALSIFIQIAAALDHGFRAEIIHREIRPDCIMVTEGDQSKLEGLGLTKDENTRFLQGENAYYVAPEQCRGREPDTRSDIYSLGCCLFHCLAGEPPFQGGSPKDVLGRRLVSDPPYLTDVNPDVAPELAEVCRRMMERVPEARFQSPAETMEALRAVTFGPQTSSQPLARTSGQRAPVRPSGRLRGARSKVRARRRRRFRK